MIKFILSFSTYPTMNSRNNAYGYSYNVKIHSLPLNADVKKVLWDAINTDEFYERMNDVITNWEEKMQKYGTHINGKERRISLALNDKRRKDGQLYEWIPNTIDESNFQAGFNGRSGGHLVLYKWNGHNICGTGWTHNKEELKEMTAYDVKEIYSILKEFERLYKMLLVECRDIAKNYKVEEEEYQETKTRQVLVEA